MAYRVASGDLKKHIEIGRRQPIMDLWWHVHGEVPPLPGASRYSSLVTDQPVGLHNSHACFRGIMRPVAEDDQGLDHVAFISKPTIGFKFVPSMSCLIEPYDIPSDLVFVTYVRLDFPEGRAYQSRNGHLPITNGVITHWQLVESDPEHRGFPIDYKTRFRRRMW